MFTVLFAVLLYQRIVYAFIVTLVKGNPRSLEVIYCSLFKKDYGSVVSNRIRMKLFKIVPPANTHRLTKSDFRFEIPLSR